MKLVEGLCPRCGRTPMLGETGGVRVALDPAPLDAQTAIGAFVEGRGIWSTNGRTARPEREPLKLVGRAWLVAEHPCPNVNVKPKPVEAPLTASQSSGGPGAQRDPQRPPAGQQTPFSGPSAAPSSVTSAEHPRSEPFSIDWSKVGEPAPAGPRCSGCGKPCADGTYASIEIGELTIWAMHVTDCPG